MTIRALCLACALVVAALDVSAQSIPFDSSPDLRWTVSSRYELFRDVPSPFDQRHPDVEFVGLRFQRDISDRVGLELSAARSVGEPSFFAEDVSHFGLSLHHTLIPAAVERGAAFSMGYELGGTWFDGPDANSGSHAQLWGVLRVFGTPDRGLSVGARGGGWYTRIGQGRRSTDVSHAESVIVTLHPMVFRFEYEHPYNTAFEGFSVYSFEVGVRW